uniref:Uncharacterized protein n=1 Tax=Alexandrium catenella TaxID=2925 RepID=A0A7S1RJ27_ALECA|mmetsp:Transcript_59816/g.160300  ORF Transcript_59816/g.160300 Transcript_59816/m.160300 type:complete len:426 (+) Transcript_59816:46-1323(+)|eukprot:CAMPEP_0171206522 /NCGR_PEP_ID=MMETSP0790-20130122/27107_1 /TAXON_ID=2925 /ORGANISM="Alexandrium catenella, Strain OF101" /LENGTH=425 /DNA_ID=CAMNT_0011672071 /DNA_START=26 /DNA_END=1303 /DNA_ORIENTATION=-
MAQTAPGWHRGVLSGMPRFAFCLAPRETLTLVSSQPVLGLCGRPLCSGSGQEQDMELSVVRVPKCSHCNAGDHGASGESELILGPDPLSSNSICQRNILVAKGVIRDVYAELEAHCAEERCHCEESGLVPARQKLNIWATYTNKARLQRFAADSMDFVRQNADCRMRILSSAQLRFLILLQHFVAEDTSDFYRPEALRKHQDAFEGVLTDGVNSQLVKDSHRSEFSVDGRSFSLQDLPQHGEDERSEDRRHAIARFQTEFIMALETYLLAFCSRRGLSPLGTRRLVQAVTTQMSQAGLANLDRGSQAARYFVGSNGLDQRTAYNLSTMHSDDVGDSLKLTILCMKTGFSQYLEKDEILKMPGVDYPKRCMPASYLYQYATLRFTPGPFVDNCESIFCAVLDALDEAHIEPRNGPAHSLVEDEVTP